MKMRVDRSAKISENHEIGFFRRFCSQSTIRAVTVYDLSRNRDLSCGGNFIIMNDLLVSVKSEFGQSILCGIAQREESKSSRSTESFDCILKYQHIFAPFAAVQTFQLGQ